MIKNVAKKNDIEVGEVKINISGPWDLKKNFWLASLKILVSSILIFSIIFSVIKLLSINLSWHILLLSTLPSTGYTLWFLGRRCWFVLGFSRRINIVLAYNLQGINREISIISRRYQSLKYILENKISEYNLGRYIKVHIKPLDIRLQDNIEAEAKTKIGLPGSTLIIWGYAIQKKGKLNFKTKYSYEFGGSNKKDNEKWKQFFTQFINKGLGDSSFFQIDEQLFGNYILAASLFILGLTAATFIRQDPQFYSQRAISLLKHLIEIHSTSSLNLQIILGQAILQAEKILLILYNLNIDRINIQKGKKGIEDIKSYCEEILKVKPEDYSANIRMAHYYGINNDISKAQHFNSLAEANSLSRVHFHIFNKAYFYFWNGNYAKGIELYESIPAEIDIKDVNTIQVRDFLYDKYKEKNDLSFLFAAGFVAYKWDDRSGGIKDLQEFVNKAEVNTQKDKYNILISKAKDLLKKDSLND